MHGNVPNLGRTDAFQLEGIAATAYNKGRDEDDECSLNSVANNMDPNVEKYVPLCHLQSLAQNKAVPDSTSECGKVHQSRGTMQHAKSLVQLLHLLRLRARVVALLAITSF